MENFCNALKEYRPVELQRALQLEGHLESSDAEHSRLARALDTYLSELIPGIYACLTYTAPLLGL